MKKILAFILVFALVLSLAGSAWADFNMTLFDTKYSFNYAYVGLPNGKTIEGKVKNWKDWDDSDMLQVTFVDGSTYYSHSSNIVLISKE